MIWKKNTQRIRNKSYQENGVRNRKCDRKGGIQDGRNFTENRIICQRDGN